MIGKIIRHPSFMKPCFYAFKGDSKRPEVLAANGVRMSSAGEMAADFELQRSARPGLRQAVEHIALAWLPEETAKLTNEVMVRAAMLYLEKRGIDPATTQWALVRHYDQEHPHCHLLLNRVTDDGQVLPDKRSHLRSAEACRKVEAAMGFEDAAQLGAAAKLREAVEGKLPAAVAERVQCKDLIRKALEKHLPTVTTVQELREALATEGVRMKATLQQGGQLQAVVLEATAYPGLHVKGSEVAREYSGVGLRKILEAQAERREAATALAEPRAQPKNLGKPNEAPDSAQRRSDIPKRTTPQVGDPTEAKTAGDVFVRQPLATPLDRPLPAKPRTQEAEQAATSPAGPSPTADRLASSELRPVAEETEQAATARYQATVFRDAAAPVGQSWESKEEATEIVQQLLRKALRTSATEAGRIIHEVRVQGFSFDKTYTMLRHNESGFVSEARLLSHGPRGTTFLEDALAVAAANKRAQLREHTRTSLTVLTERQPPMWSMDRDDLVRELGELKLTVTWPGAVNGVGGTLTIEPTGTGVTFLAEELPLRNGQPLLPRLQELGAANWATKERQVLVYCTDESRASQVQQTLPLGVLVRPLEPAVAGAFAISYQLDSPAIDRIAAGFDASIYYQPGVRVSESVAAMVQRSNAAEQRAVERNAGLSPSKDKGRE
jgi:hypothetical protein